MPNTPLSLITPGMRFISWTPADEDVIRLAFRLLARNGIRRLQIADPSNDPAADPPPRARSRARKASPRSSPGLTYSISAVHTHAYYAERAAALADCAELDRLYLKDPGGLLTPEAVRELAPHCSPRPASSRSSCTAIARSGSRRSSTSKGSRRASTPCTPRRARLPAAPPSPRCSRPFANLEAAGLRARPRPGRSRRSSPGTSSDSPARRACRRATAQRVRRRLLPPSASGRHGHDHPPHARGAPPARALRRRARGGHARAGGDGLPDHRHAGLAVHREPGGAQRDRRRAVGQRRRRDRALLPGPLRRPAGTGRPRRRRPGARRPQVATAAHARAAEPRRRPRPFRAPASPTRSCCFA